MRILALLTLLFTTGCGLMDISRYSAFNEPSSNETYSQEDFEQELDHLQQDIDAMEDYEQVLIATKQDAGSKTERNQINKDLKQVRRDLGRAKTWKREMAVELDRVRDDVAHSRAWARASRYAADRLGWRTAYLAPGGEVLVKTSADYRTRKGLAQARSRELNNDLKAEKLKAKKRENYGVIRSFFAWFY